MGVGVFTLGLVVRGMGRRKRSLLEQVAIAIRELQEENKSQLDYEAEKVMIKLLLADTLAEYKEIRRNTPKDIKDRVFELANTKHPLVFRKLKRLTDMSIADRNPDKTYFLGDCL